MALHQSQILQLIKLHLPTQWFIHDSFVLRSLRHYLRVPSQGHYTTDHIKQRGIEKESSQWSSLKGQERVIVSQTNTGTVWKATLGKVWGMGWSAFFLSTVMPAWTELEFFWNFPVSSSISINKIKIKSMHDFFVICNTFKFTTSTVQVLVRCVSTSDLLTTPLCSFEACRSVESMICCCFSTENKPVQKLLEFPLKLAA